MVAKGRLAPQPWATPLPSPPKPCSHMSGFASLCGRPKPQSSSIRTFLPASDSSTLGTVWVSSLPLKIRRGHSDSQPFKEGPQDTVCGLEERVQALDEKECSWGTARGVPSKAQNPGRGLLARVKQSLNQRGLMSSQTFPFSPSPRGLFHGSTNSPCMPASYLKLKFKPNFLPQGQLQHTQLQPRNTRHFTAQEETSVNPSQEQMGKSQAAQIFFFRWTVLNRFL